MTSPDDSVPAVHPSAEQITALTSEGASILSRMSAVNTALNLLGHAMSCGKVRTQAAAYDELLDAFAEMTSAWNARAELAEYGIEVAQNDPCWGEEHG